MARVATAKLDELVNLYADELERHARVDTADDVRAVCRCGWWGRPYGERPRSYGLHAAAAYRKASAAFDAAVVRAIEEANAR